MESKALKIYLADIQKELAVARAGERALYPALKALLESFDPGVTATIEPSRTECGAPDFLVTRTTKHGPLTIGYVEAKDVEQNLDDAERSDQMKRYLKSLRNLILTDFLEFRWYVDGAHRQTARLGRLAPTGKLTIEKGGSESLMELLKSFLTHEPEPVAKPKDLAVRMARLTHIIRDIIIEAFEKGKASTMLGDLRKAFATALIPDLDKPDKTAEFADMFAQTLAYGLFAARCNHEGAPETFKRLGAASEIPKTNPFLRKFFDTVTRTELDDEPFVGFVDDLAQLLAHADMEAILLNFGKRKGKEDPVVHFYETFLTAYDPRMRKIRGVYYTPEAVVSYIVRSVDYLLKTRFGCPDGLADTQTIEFEEETEKGKAKRKAPKVLILDPACGTGTFLYTVVDLVREKFSARGDAGMWSGYVKEHLLPRLFGFELLMAPYAVAHFKLGMQLAGFDLDEPLRKTWAYDFSGDERLGIYLTNSLEEAEKISEYLPGPFRIITEEANAAAKVKRDLPIMVLMGNPPYSLFGRMNRGDWILGLLEDYKKGLHEKKLNIDDDFIKFIRLGQWRIEKTGCGILAFITNNSYIDGITHRRMRESLMETFTDIYILDLHGSKKKKERCPDGSEDKNVFDIQQGVVIGIFVKEPEERKRLTRVHHADLWGLRGHKYNWLLERDIASTDWMAIEPKSKQFFLVPKDFRLEGEYSLYTGLGDIFPTNQNGLKTDRDDLFFDFDKEILRERIKIFFSEAGLTPEFGEAYRVEDSSSYDLLSRRKQTSFDPLKIRECFYRPFDKRWLYYAPGLTSRPAWEVMRHMLTGENVALVATRQFGAHKHFVVLCGRGLIEISSQPYAPYNVHPLYIYPALAADLKQREKWREKSSWPEGKGGSKPNLSAGFVADIEKRLGLKFISDGSGDLKETFGPEDIFHYIYAVFHSPTYRKRYAEFLKIDFPRVPLTSNLDLFKVLVQKGADLVALHLLEENYPASSWTISKKSSPFANFITRFPVRGDNLVEKGHPRYISRGEKVAWQEEPIQAGRVYISKDDPKPGRQGQYFEGVPPEVWEFQVGGYQVCQKWLKDRRGRKLTHEDLTHYQKIIIALKETIRLMSEIDAEIPTWPIG